MVYKLVTTQAFAAQQSLSGFKITLHVFAHLQYDDTNCRQAIRAFVERNNTTKPYDKSSSTFTLSGSLAQLQGSVIFHIVHSQQNSAVI